jgi:hypothetical protein
MVSCDPGTKSAVPRTLILFGPVNPHDMCDLSKENRYLNAAETVVFSSHLRTNPNLASILGKRDLAYSHEPK